MPNKNSFFFFFTLWVERKKGIFLFFDFGCKSNKKEKKIRQTIPAVE
jgi:hypothetical protein